MVPGGCDLLAVVGPTASGKTGLGVAMARRFGGEIISADSRQVYRGLDIGTGKDLWEYREGGDPVAYHLIDIVDVHTEFNVFGYQQAFYRVLDRLRARSCLPVVVGGSGMYLEAVLQHYRLVDVPVNHALRDELSALTDAELGQRLLDLKPDHHTRADLRDRERMLRAIEIALYSRDHEPEPAPPMTPLVLGVQWPRQVLRQRIRRRLRERLQEGLVEEVEGLLADGVPPTRLRSLGLEYRYVTEYLQGEIRSSNDLEQKLGSAICAFAKRQDTWFRRMERRGTTIHWVPGNHPERAVELAQRALG